MPCSRSNVSDSCLSFLLHPYSCSTGIGFETAQALANKGFTVFATVRKAEHFEKLKNAIANQAAKNRLVMVLLDVTDTAQVAAAAQQVKAELQKRKLHLQSLINNAGYAAPGPLEIIPAAAARAQFDTNVFGAISVTNAFAPLLRESKSKIAPSVINITSVVAEIVPPGLALYAASKHAFHAITVGYRMELSAWGINVVEVQPGSIKTSFVDTVKLGYNSNVAIDESKQDEVLMHYSKVGSKFLEDAELMANKMSSGPAVVAGVIEEALRTNRPLATYRCGKDAHVTLPLGNIAPWAIDLVGKFTFKKRN